MDSETLRQRLEGVESRKAAIQEEIDRIRFMFYDIRHKELQLVLEHLESRIAKLESNANMR